MFLQLRLLSVPRHSASLVLAAITFMLGLGIGSTLGPVTAGRASAPFAAPAVPATSLQPTEALPVLRTAHPADVVRVLDGDTFEARVHLWPGLNITTKVRLRGIDAPELKSRCVEERTKAEASRGALQAILDQGEVGIMRVALDKYGGRVIADASTRTTPDVSSALLNAGLARRYAGARRETWCP